MFGVIYGTVINFASLVYYLVPSRVYSIQEGVVRGNRMLFDGTGRVRTWQGHR